MPKPRITAGIGKTVKLVFVFAECGQNLLFTVAKLLVLTFACAGSIDDGIRLIAGVEDGLLIE